jgi:hypothetical protein
LVVEAAGTNAAAVGFDGLGQVWVLYHGLEALGGGGGVSRFLRRNAAGTWRKAVAGSRLPTRAAPHFQNSDAYSVGRRR